MLRRRVWVILALSLMVLAAACGGDEEGGEETGGATAETGGATAETGGGEGITIGVSWNNYNEERWAKWDEPAIIEGLATCGAEYISSDAGSSAEQQLTDVENLIAQAKVTIESARNREESRGAHAREDFPERNDETWLKHTIAWCDDKGSVRIDYRPVHMQPLSNEVQSFPPKERVY